MPQLIIPKLIRSYYAIKNFQGSKTHAPLWAIRMHNEKFLIILIQKVVVFIDNSHLFIFFVGWLV